MNTVWKYTWRTALLCYLLGIIGYLPFGKPGGDWAAGLAKGVMLSSGPLVLGALLGLAAGVFVHRRGTK